MDKIRCVENYVGSSTFETVNYKGLMTEILPVYVSKRHPTTTVVPVLELK